MQLFWLWDTSRRDSKLLWTYRHPQTLHRAQTNRIHTLIDLKMAPIVCMLDTYLKLQFNCLWGKKLTKLQSTSPKRDCVLGHLRPPLVQTRFVRISSIWSQVDLENCWTEKIVVCVSVIFSKDHVVRRGFYYFLCCSSITADYRLEYLPIWCIRDWNSAIFGQYHCMCFFLKCTSHVEIPGPY